MNKSFLMCKTCGNILKTVKFSDKTPICCNNPMVSLVPNTTDAAIEKHVPHVVCNNDEVTIKIGEILHPMSEEHLITWVEIETNTRVISVDLNSDTAPIVEFKLEKNEKLKKVYAYCNLHGLWLKEFEK